MKASELMIGDWCRMRRCDVPDTTFYTSKALCLQKDGFLEYEPIPLTAEILEKNGFRKGSYVGGYYYPLFAFRVFPTTRDIKIETFGDEIFYHCRYVHELQHALRLCGLNELADKFKVE